jgi:predicted kinase
VCKLLIICGISFAGKSTLGAAIAQRFGYAEVDVDVTKVDLHGEDTADERLTQSDWDAIYNETDNRVLSHLRAGRSVLDASRNFRKAERDNIRRLTAGLGVPIITIFVDTPEAVARQRLFENRLSKTRPDLSESVFEHIARLMEPPGIVENPLIFSYQADIGWWIEKHTNWLSPITL